MDRLTAYQREVATLIVQGWTNREVGEGLCITPGTVANLVALSSTGLGQPSRLQVAHLAAEHSARLARLDMHLRSPVTGRSISPDSPYLFRRMSCAHALRMRERNRSTPGR